MVSPPAPDLPHCWSEIPLDLMRLVFERLSFADFEQAKSVCSSWESASKQSQPNNKIPWMILFPEDNNYGVFFNPEEKDKVYKTQDLGNDFGKIFCVATCRSWLLMQPNHSYYFKGNIDDAFQYNLYILDLLTGERINIPTLELVFGLIAPIFWIDGETKDYLVIGMVNNFYAVSFKKGDNSWKKVPQLSDIAECLNMVYKDHKLYCLNYYKLKIFDFSREIPVRVFKIQVDGCTLRLLRCPGRPPPNIPSTRVKHNVVIRLSGDVLIVRSMRPSMSKIWEFKIYKMDTSKENTWEEIVSLGDEAILLDLGITVLAKDREGIKRNLIYFNGSESQDKNDGNDIVIFNLDRKKAEQPHKIVCSSVACSNARWFFPSFKSQ